MLLLMIVIDIMGGSILFYVGQVLITIAESSFCSYGTVLCIRDVPLLCHVDLCALCAYYAHAAHCMRGKCIDFTYWLCRVPEMKSGYKLMAKAITTTLKHCRKRLNKVTHIPQHNIEYQGLQVYVYMYIYSLFYYIHMHHFDSLIILLLGYS